jgi:hypothetical protein
MISQASWAVTCSKGVFMLVISGIISSERLSSAPRLNLVVSAGTVMPTDVECAGRRHPG